MSNLWREHLKFMEPVRGKSDMETAYTNTISEY